MNAWKLSGAGLVIAALVVATSALSKADPAAPARPLESTDEDECFEWQYPKEDACGNLKGKKECKARPTIEGSDDDEKKEKCQPTKGDTCFCE
jgi:hypothetical protein